MLNGTPLWTGQLPDPSPSLDSDLTVDVAIIGAGMAGLHCALSLRDSGLDIAIFEARRIGQQATGRSTAKVTSQHGLRYAQLIRDFGREAAASYASCNQAAVETIADLCRSMPDGAAFERKDAYVYAADPADVDRLRQEAEAARSLGLPASFEGAASLPFDTSGLLKFAGQGQFNPFAYLQGLAGLVRKQVRLFEASRVTSVDAGEPCRLSVNGHTVEARHVVATTQMPVVAEGMFFARAFPFAHPVAAAPLPAGLSIDGMFISAAEPSHSIRTATQDGRPYLVVAGMEYEPGVPEQQEHAIADLRKFLSEKLGIREPSHLWTNEDFRPMDGVAFIGPASSGAPHLYVATGFDAWGITQGVVAGEIIAARIKEDGHPATDLFDAKRLNPVSGGARFLKENLQTGTHMVSDRLLRRKVQDQDEIGPAEGGVISVDGKQVAVRRREDGGLSAVSAVCTHMGCIVDWNPVDRTWDCPCHGSRFDENGHVLSGPATEPLAPHSLPSTVGRK